MDALWAWLWGTGWFWLGMFWVALLVNGRAAFKLLLDWKGMLTTCRFVEEAYEKLATLPETAPSTGSSLPRMAAGHSGPSGRRSNRTTSR